MTPGNRGPIPSSECLQEVLEACANLPLKADTVALRDYVAESTRRIFQACLAGILVRENDTYILEPVRFGASTVVQTELVSCAKTCAIQAIHQQKLLDFRFSPEKSEDKDYHGLTQSLQTGAASTALLVMRKTPFSPNEISAFRVLGHTSRLALDNVELAGLSSEQHRKRAESLIEMALELGSALRLPEFVTNFTARVADMMQAECAILALAQGR